MKYKLLVFDLDGTLVDTIPDISDVFNSVLAERGFPVHPAEEYYSFVGWGLKRTLELVMPEGFSNHQVFGEMKEEIHRRYAAQAARRSYVYPGISRLVEEMAKRQVPMIVYTNKDQRIAESVLENFFPGGVFSGVIGFTGEFPAKPDPGALVDHLSGLNTPLSSILLIGDTPVDLETAVNAGVDFAGVTWGFRTALELRESGSLLNFNSPVELHNWLIKEVYHDL